MTTIDTGTRLADLVTAHPRLARELERRGLDFCCGGDQTMDEACRAAGLDPATVAAELAAVTAAADDERAPWATMGPAELVDHIVDSHHRFLWDELPRAEAERWLRAVCAATQAKKSEFSTRSWMPGLCR